MNVNMQKTCSEIKDQARAHLQGKYGVLILALLCNYLLQILISSPFSKMLNIGLQFQVVSRTILGYIGIMLVSLLALLLETGILSMHLKAARKQTFTFSELFFCFRNHPNHFLGYGLIVVLLSFVCELPGLICLFLAGRYLPDLTNTAVSDVRAMFPLLLASTLLLLVGLIVQIILLLGLSQTQFFLLDEPQQPLMQALRKSLDIMKGNKGRLFRLYLSFIGWFFLGLLTLGIGYLWIIPYINQSLAEFHLDLIGEAEPQADPNETYL